MHKRVYTQTHAVVGAIIEKDGKIVLVKEAHGHARGLWNQPAGWIEVGEHPLDAVKKEVKEETGYDFTPTAVLGVYSLHKYSQPEGRQAGHGVKIIFLGDISAERSELSGDTEEIRWFSPEEISAMQRDVLRDADIKQEVRDFLAGKRYPLELIVHTKQGM